MGLPAENIEVIRYSPIPTIRQFHASNAKYRAIVGTLGSAKTTGGAMEVGYYLPIWLAKNYGIKRTKWAVIRNTYRELTDTTMASVFEWFPEAHYKKSEETITIKYAGGIESVLIFRACDTFKDVRKFRSLELTGCWVDESIEVADEHKLTLSGRINRYPKASKWPLIGYKENGDPIYDVQSYFIETTTPPDITMPIYSDYAWTSSPPGPLPEKEPLEDHVGFWQPPRENERNLAPNYYADLKHRYRDYPDWIEIYVEGMPGIIVRGKRIYHNFKRKIHVSHDTIPWIGGPLYRGWDNSGNVPACVIVQIPSPGRYQAIKEFFNDKANIVNFTNDVVGICNQLYPDCDFIDWADPAGNNEYPTKDGGFTSNARLMKEAAGVVVRPSEQNPTARINAVDDTLSRIDGLFIDPGCTRLINGFLGGYCYAKNQMTGEYSDKPEKNRFAHLQEALQYVLVKLVKSNAGMRSKRIVVPRDYTPRTEGVHR